MSTKNVILGAAATCLAVGSAFASYLTVLNQKVKIGTTVITVTTTAAPACPTGGPKCLIKVVSVGGTNTIATAATLMTTGGINPRVGGGLVTNTIARTRG